MGVNVIDKIIDRSQFRFRTGNFGARHDLCSFWDVGKDLGVKRIKSEYDDKNPAEYIFVKESTPVKKLTDKMKKYVVQHGPFPVTDRVYERQNFYVDMLVSGTMAEATAHYLLKHDRLFVRFAYTILCTETLDVLFLLKALLFFDVVILVGDARKLVEDDVKDVLCELRCLTLDDFVGKYTLNICH